VNVWVVDFIVEELNVKVVRVEGECDEVGIEEGDEVG